MRRRTWLQLGAASAAVLAVGGGSIALMRPAWSEGRLSATGREVFLAAAAALLQGTLPAAAPARDASLAALLERIEALVAGLPAHAQAEVSQLLSLLASAPGRRFFAGLEAPWRDARIEQVQAALQAMRISSLALRQQVYQALHDIVGGAYFSEPRTWDLLGYPGPRPI
jgi:hypothetical protein